MILPLKAGRVPRLCVVYAMAESLSISGKLTLRYTAAMSVTITLVGLFSFVQIERRVNREANLLLEVLVYDLVEAYRSQREEHSPERLLEWFEERVAQAVEDSDPALGLGIELLDLTGSSVLSAGVLKGKKLPLSQLLIDHDKESVFRAVNLGEKYAYLSMTRPVPDGFIRVVLNSQRYAENVQHIRDVYLLSLPLMMLLTGVVGWFLARGSLRPISQITATARRIRGGNLDEKIPLVGSGDELDQLALTLNEMLERIQGSVEKMHRFNANAAHELRTPLNAMRSQVEVTLEQERSPNEYREVLHGVLEQVHRLAAGTDAMLQLSRSEEGLKEENRKPVNLGPVLETVVDFFSPLAEEQGLELQCQAIPNATVSGDASWLHQLFANLISNGIKYSDSGGCVEVVARVEPGWICVDVKDCGKGLSPEDTARIFERFHRAEVDRNCPGVGLGLPIAQEVARAHGGRIDVESELGQGTTFSVWLPLLA